jgi:hypothetical protein
MSGWEGTQKLQREERTPVKIQQLTIVGERAGELTLKLREDGMVVYTVRSAEGVQVAESGFWASRSEEGEESLRETASEAYREIHGYHGTKSDVDELTMLMGRVG